MLKHIPFYSSLLGRTLDGKKSTNSHVLTYGAIEAHSFGERGCIASNKTIASETGLTEGTVANALSAISKAGWVNVKLDNYNHRQLITPLLTIETPLVRSEPPITEGLTPPNPPINPPLVGSEHRIQLGNNEVTYRKTIAKAIEKEAVLIAQRLAVCLVDNYGFMANRIKPKDHERWAKDIEKLHRIDGYDYEIIKSVMDWSQQDDFWKQNIRSGSKLRKQFENLLVRIKSEKQRMVVIS